MQNYRILKYFCQLVGVISLLFFGPFSPIPFEVPKVHFVLWIIRVSILIAVYQIVKTKVNWKIDKYTLWALSAYLLVILLTSMLGVDFTKSLWGNPYRVDGLVTLFTLAAGALTLSFFWKENFKIYISEVFFVASTTSSVFTIWQVVTGQFGLGSAFTFGNPNFLAGFLVVSVPFSYYLFQIKRQKYIFIAILTILAAIVLIGAVSAILTLIIWLSVIVIVHIKSNIKYGVIVLMGLVAGIILYGWSVNYLQTNSESFIAEGRVRIYRNILIASLSRPLIGYGWANIDVAFQSVQWPTKFNDDVYVDKAHSQLLEVFASAGFVGLVTYILLITVLIKKLVKLSKLDKQWALVTGMVLVMYLLHSQTNVISISEDLAFWTVTGILLKK